MGWASTIRWFYFALPQFWFYASVGSLSTVDMAMNVTCVVNSWFVDKLTGVRWRLMLLTVVNRWEAPPLSCATTRVRWHLLQHRGLQKWRNIVTEKLGTKCSEFPGSSRVIEHGPSSLAWAKSSLLQRNPRGYLLLSHQSSWSGCIPSLGDPWKW